MRFAMGAMASGRPIATFANDYAAGDADIAFYAGDTGRIHTGRCVRHPKVLSWFPGARQATA